MAFIIAMVTPTWLILNSEIDMGYFGYHRMALFMYAYILICSITTFICFSQTYIQVNISGIKNLQLNFSQANFKPNNLRFIPSFSGIHFTDSICQIALVHPLVQ